MAWHGMVLFISGKFSCAGGGKRPASNEGWKGKERKGKERKGKERKGLNRCVFGLSSLSLSLCVCVWQIFRRFWVVILDE
jgi:hypothetical protein